MSFEQYWQFINKRGVDSIQERSELEHVFNLMQGCESYLEIGTAEGNSMYVLAHALKPNSHISYVDWDEKHTREQRNEVINLLTDEGYDVRGIHANTLHRHAIDTASDRKYDVVLIDAGHTYEEVLADARNYGHLATKYIIFHDVMLPEVERAFAEYQKEVGLHGTRFVNSTTFGFGILRVA